MNRHEVLEINNQINTKNPAEEQVLPKIKKINLNNNQGEGVHYTKSRKISFPVKGLTFTNIPVLKSVKLAFYEKYIILLMQKGIVGKTPEDIIAKISNLLNISTKCVAEFIEHLMDENFLLYNKNKGLFYLDDAIHFAIDRNYDDAMFAELETRLADCSKIVFVNEANTFYLEEDFSEEVFKRKGSSSTAANEGVEFGIIDLVNSSESTLRPLFIKHFNSTNLHLKHDFSYNLKTDIYLDYQYEFETLFEYKYFKETKKAVVQNISLQKDNILSDDFVKQLIKHFEEDDKLPRFIELEESFYEKIEPDVEDSIRLSNIIEEEKNRIDPLVEEKAGIKESLVKLKKAHKIKKQEEIDSKENLEKLISECEEEISLAEQVINSKDNTNNDLVRNLKKKVHELKETKKTLEDQLQTKQKELEQLIKNQQKDEENLNDLIESKEDEISEVKVSVQQLEAQQGIKNKEINELIDNNKKKMNSTVQDVLGLYSKEKNIFSKKVITICTWLDSALSAAECEAYDEVVDNIGSCRENYRRVLQTVFELLLKKKEETLGDLIFKNHLAIENILKKRGAKNFGQLVNKLEEFHTLTGALGHLGENGSKREENIQTLENFKKKPLREKEIILLVVPMILIALNLSIKEQKEISDKLKI